MCSEDSFPSRQMHMNQPRHAGRESIKGLLLHGSLLHPHLWSVSILVCLILWLHNDRLLLTLSIGVTPENIQSGLGPLGESVSCQECQRRIRDRVRDIVTSWSRVPVSTMTPVRHFSISNHDGCNRDLSRQIATISMQYFQSSSFATQFPWLLVSECM